MTVGLKVKFNNNIFKTTLPQSYSNLFKLFKNRPKLQCDILPSLFKGVDPLKFPKSWGIEKNLFDSWFASNFFTLSMLHVLQLKVKYIIYNIVGRSLLPPPPTPLFHEDSPSQFFPILPSLFCFLFFCFLLP